MRKGWRRSRKIQVYCFQWSVLYSKIQYHLFFSHLQFTPYFVRKQYFLFMSLIPEKLLFFLFLEIFEDIGLSLFLIYHNKDNFSLNFKSDWRIKFSTNPYEKINRNWIENKFYNFSKYFYFSLFQSCISGWLTNYSFRCQPVDYSRNPAALRVHLKTIDSKTIARNIIRYNL